MMTRNKKLAVTITLGVISAVLPFVAERWWAPDFFRNKPDLESIWSLFCVCIAGGLIMLTLHVEQRLNEHESMEELEGQLNRILKGMTNQVEPLGPALTLFETQNAKLRRLAEKAISVKNTLIFYSDSERNFSTAHSEGYLVSRNYDFRAQIMRMVLSHGHWMDIYSEQGLKSFNPEIENLQKQYPTNYRPRVMQGHYPVVNMTLFECDDQPEVWFGFGFFDDGFSRPVFSSRNPDLCKFFEMYFDVLAKNSRPWLSKGPQYIEGAWLTASYGSTEIDSFAVVQATNSIDGITLRGKIFEPRDGEFEPVRSFRSTSSHFSIESSGPMLVFTFQDIIDDRDDARGSGLYRFKSNKSLIEFTGQVSSYGGLSKRIYGRRLNDGNAELMLDMDENKIEILVIGLIADGSLSQSKPRHSPFSGKAFFSPE